MIFAIVTFPGSNCDRDCLDAVGRVLGYETRNVFHKERSLGPCDVVVLPGGFSYGDYLRAGALAKLSPIMDDVIRFAEAGGIVMGICNGFQVLCEAGLLPGALLRNRGLKFVSRFVTLRVENSATAFTALYAEGERIQMPIAHGEGGYVADQATIRGLEERGQVVFRYDGPLRPDVPDGNPNGSIHAIAGIMNERGNVLGLMPHPERVCDPALGATDGARIFRSMAAEVMRAVDRDAGPFSREDGERTRVTDESRVL